MSKSSKVFLRILSGLLTLLVAFFLRLKLFPQSSFATLESIGIHTSFLDQAVVSTETNLTGEILTGVDLSGALDQLSGEADTGVLIGENTNTLVSAFTYTDGDKLADIYGATTVGLQTFTDPTYPYEGCTDISGLTSYQAPRYIITTSVFNGESVNFFNYTVYDMQKDISNGMEKIQNLQQKIPTYELNSQSGLFSWDTLLKTCELELRRTAYLKTVPGDSSRCQIQQTGNTYAGTICADVEPLLDGLFTQAPSTPYRSGTLSLIKDYNTWYFTYQIADKKGFYKTTFNSLGAGSPGGFSDYCIKDSDCNDNQKGWLLGTIVKSDQTLPRLKAFSSAMTYDEINKNIFTYLQNLFDGKEKSIYFNTQLAQVKQEIDKLY